MQSLGVTASQVNQALRSINLNAAGGQAEIAGSRQSVRVLGNTANAYDLGADPDRARAVARTVHLSDIADGLRWLWPSRSAISKMNGRRVVDLLARAAPRARRTSRVYDDAMKKIDKLEGRIPGSSSPSSSPASTIPRTQYSSSIDAMVEGAVLAVVVVFLFLRDWRATLISALAIPLSAIPTFWFMDLMGFTLNHALLAGAEPRGRRAGR